MSRRISHPEHFTHKVFNNWHRYALSDDATMIDIDGLEYCRRCRWPLAFIESAHDIGQSVKPVTVLRTLAKVTGIDTYVILFSVDEAARDREDWANACTSFRVRRVYPPPETEWLTMNPARMDAFLMGLRRKHQCRQPVARRCAQCGADAAA